MTALDLIYLAVIAVVLSFGHFVSWPAFLQRSQIDQGRARIRIWSATILQLWTLLGAGVAVWLVEARAWGALRLLPLHGWRLWGALFLTFGLIISQGRTIARIVRSRRSKRVTIANQSLARFVPHTRSDLWWWVALSLSAGIGEEFVFRGYLIWALQPLAGLWGAALMSLVLFAAAHAYQGAKGVLGVGIVGGLLTLVVLVFASLWPAVVLHALLDIGQGLVAWLAVNPVSRADREALATA